MVYIKPSFGTVKETMTSEESLKSKKIFVSYMPDRELIPRIYKELQISNKNKTN